jgi:Coenzyme PQQ synthesis protein D (PqqD)
MTGMSIRRDDSIMIREVDGEILVLDVASNLVHHLNPTATFIWRLCADGASAEEIAERVAEAFDVDIEAARRDTQALLAALHGLRLIDRP